MCLRTGLLWIMEIRIELVDLDYEYKIWKNLLSHYKNELTIIEGRLAELDGNPPLISSKQLDQHKEFIERGITKMKIQEEEMTAYINDFPISKQHEIAQFHLSIERDVNEIKKQQSTFLTILSKVQIGTN